MSLVSLYDEASLWMTPSGVKDGKLFSELPVPEYGPEEVANGDFATDSDWTKESGWTISGGSANCLNGQGVSIYQTNVLDIGKYYKLTFTVSNYSQGFLGSIGNDFGGVVADTYGSYEIFGTATSTFFGFSAFGNFIGSIDNVSVKEVIKGDGDFTFSRGSNLAATRVGPTGLIEKGRENLLTYSNTFSHSSWMKSNISVTSGQTGYDGNNDAWLYTINGPTHHFIQNVSSSGVNVFSVYAKAGTADGIVLRLIGTPGNPYIFWNLLDGSYAGSGGGGGINGASQQVLNVGNGWYRIQITAIGATQVVIYGGTSLGGFAASGNILIQDAQLELGLAATDYIESGATTGKAGLLEDEPRLDYSGGATCPSLLLEPSRTNLVPFSEYWKGYFTIDTDVTISVNVATSPEGVQNAGRLKYDLASRSMYKSAMGLTGEHSVSFWVKGDGSNIGKTFNLRLQGTSIDQNIPITLTSDWVRVEAQTNGLNILELNNRNSTTIDTGSLLLYGFQIEQASYPTSYIPNHSGGSVTRSRDTGSLNLVGAGINDGWTSGTILIEFEKPYNNENNDVIRIHGNSVSGRAYIYNNGYGFASDWSYSSNFTIGDNTKIIYRLNTLSTANLFKNGVKFTGAEGSGTAWSNIKYIYLNNQVGAKINIKQIVVFPTALTDSECIKLTTL